MRARWQTLRDRLSVLEDLWAVAAVTAALTVAMNLAVRALGLRLPDWLEPLGSALDPAQGFLVAAIVSAVGYLTARERRQERLRRAASAATDLLETELGLASHAWRPTYRGVTLRSLSRAARSSELVEALGKTFGGRPFAKRLQELVNDFERKTSHSAGQLSPPRANELVAQIIRRGPELSLEAATYADRELRSVADPRHEPRETDAKGIAEPLLQLVNAAEALEVLANRRAAEGAERQRDQLAEQAQATQRELQEQTAVAAVQLLADVKAGLAEPIETIGDEGLLAWQARIGDAQNAFREAVGGRGGEMHPRTHRAWITTNDAATDVGRKISDLRSQLQAADHARVPEARADVIGVVERLSRRVDELQGIRLR